MVLLRVKGAKPGDAGFKAINPLQIDMSLQNQIGREFVAMVLFNGMLKVSCMNRKQYEDAKSVGKVVTKVERIKTTPSTDTLQTPVVVRKGMQSVAGNMK